MLHGEKPSMLFPERQVIARLVLTHSVDAKPSLTLVPQNTLSEFFLPLHAFDYSKNCKNGCMELSKKMQHENVKIDTTKNLSVCPGSLSPERPVPHALQRISHPWLPLVR